MNGKMYCRKCKQNFEDGSRRFCPTDGWRLVSEAAHQSGPQREGGIFANLIPKIEGLRELDNTAPDDVNFAITQPNIDLSDTRPDEAEKSEVFFELDDVQLEFPAEPQVIKPAEIFRPAPVRNQPPPIGRKVNPKEIPKGHFDLGDVNRTQGTATEFRAGDPEGFVGKTVKGRYQVTEFLGGDETGLAYLAADKIVNNKMVLVRILLDSETDEIMASILAEERISLSHFSHPNIARMIDSGQFTDGTDFLVSEYVDALSVREILSIHGQFSDLRAARVIRQAANALNEAHQEGILHRDLRPENLIIDAATGDVEQTKLVNFGASNGDPTPRNFMYKAHEVLDGRIATGASDIFSLAVVAYEMLTGMIPFGGVDAKDVVRSQHAGMEMPPTSVRPDLPYAVDGVLAKAFAFNAADRYPRARDFGDAFYSALAEPKPVPAFVVEPIPDAEPILAAMPPARRTETLKPLVPLPARPAEAKPPTREPLSKKPTASPKKSASETRQIEPPRNENPRSKAFAVIGGLLLVTLLAGGAYFFIINPLRLDGPSLPPPEERPTVQTNSEPPASPPTSNTQMPPQPRNVPQPPNTAFYQNNKQNLKGDLLRNFVGFTMYYPKDWKVNGPREGATAGSRGKFLDISRIAPDGRLKEQMLISYYPSKGTFADDAGQFPQMVKETNETLKKILPGYQMVSEREIIFNGAWRAYEIKFQGGGTSEKGEKIVVWGRRLFIPAARPGVRNGFEITMLATSAAAEVRSVDDIGIRGELGPILYSFEPSQNF